MVQFLHQNDAMPPILMLVHLGRGCRREIFGTHLAAALSLSLSPGPEDFALQQQLG
jgi:hypothetical protein